MKGEPGTLELTGKSQHTSNAANMEVAADFKGLHGPHNKFVAATGARSKKAVSETLLIFFRLVGNEFQNLAQRLEDTFKP